MFTVEKEGSLLSEDFKSLQDARDYIKYDCEYGSYTIWSIDGQPQESYKGSREVDAFKAWRNIYD